MMKRYPSILVFSLLLLPVSQAPAQQQEDLYEQVGRAAVEILVDRRLAGCGCIVDPDGLVLTAAHVVKNARTRIEVVTEGVFSRMILSDPELAGVSLVIFDEFISFFINSL